MPIFGIEEPGEHAAKLPRQLLGIGGSVQEIDIPVIQGIDGGTGGENVGALPLQFLQSGAGLLKLGLVQEGRGKQPGILRQSEKCVPGIRFGQAGAGNAVLFADLPLNGQQRFQKSGSGGEIPLYFGFLLEGGILGEIAVPGVPAIVVADGGNVIHILLQKRGGF